MKKTISLFLTLIVSFSLFVGTVSADHTNHTLEAVEARSDANGGVIIIFRFGGDWDNSEIKTLKQGTVFLGDEKYGLHCKIEGDLVHCTTSRVVSGNTVRIYLGGFTLFAFIRPTGGVSSGSGGCYNIYNLTEGSGQSQVWINDGTHCQTYSASVNDLLDYNFQLFSFQLSSPTSSCVPTPVNEGAYYAFVSC